MADLSEGETADDGVEGLIFEGETAERLRQGGEIEMDDVAALGIGLPICRAEGDVEDARGSDLNGFEAEEWCCGTRGACWIGGDAAWLRGPCSSGRRE